MCVKGSELDYRSADQGRRFLDCFQHLSEKLLSNCILRQIKAFADQFVRLNHPEFLFGRASYVVSFRVCIQHAFLRLRTKAENLLASESTPSWSTRFCFASSVHLTGQSEATCSWNTHLYSVIHPGDQVASLNPRPHGARVCTRHLLTLVAGRVSIHVPMEHAFVLLLGLLLLLSQSTCPWNTRLYPCLPRLRTSTWGSQSTCPWNTRLYRGHLLSRRRWRLNPRAHGTRVCTRSPAQRGPHRSQSTCSWNTRLYVDPNHTPRAGESQSTCSWNTRLYDLDSAGGGRQRLNPRAHGTRVCTPYRT